MQTHVREFEADLVVLARTLVADDVVSLDLAAPDGAPLPPWTPGAHVDLILDDGSGGGADGGIERQYSLCGSPARTDRWRVAVLRAPDGRGGSARVHDRLVEGATVRVRGPRNHFALAAADRYLFLAGGIGITPLLPMVAEAAAAGADWHLWYGGRRLTSMAFRDELAGHGDRVTLVPQDTDGLLDLDAVLGDPRPDTLVYACGPEALLAAVEQRCAAWPADALRLERFAARAEADRGTDTAFEVVLQRSGLTVPVPAGTSVLEAVRAAGVSVLGSCLEGVCGTCETEVLAGEVDHRDSVLSAAEQEEDEVMMICVSRCRGQRLTLDL